MKFLLDQDVYAITAEYLSSLGHDVVTAKELGLSQSADEEILRKAIASSRILVTRDRDFGNLVFVRKVGMGVIYLRVNPLTIDGVHGELQRVINEHDEKELSNAFVVIEPSGYRVRRIPN
jgi:predicted nuclease of predicted toxin-antitoxin system